MRRLFRVVGRTLFLLLVYVVSYAPFLWAVTFFGSPYHRSPYYRSPAPYRVADWLVARTSAGPVVLSWASCFNVRGTMEMQAWYFAQGVSDTSEFHFNIQ